MDGREDVGQLNQSGKIKSKRKNKLHEIIMRNQERRWMIRKANKKYNTIDFGRKITRRKVKVLKESLKGQ